jgi:formylglycine-generating enzyme required for sulfatase activity
MISSRDLPAVESPNSLEIKIGNEIAVFRRVSPKDYRIDYPDFYLLETEVTNHLYREYLRATGKRKDDTDVVDILKRSNRPPTVTYSYREIKNGPVDKDGWQVTGEMTGAISEVIEISTGGPTYSLSDETTVWRNGTYPTGLDDHPVALLTLSEATAFCEWLSRSYPAKGIFRLPTWNEWMIAAYGRSRSYPWGDKWDRSLTHSSYSRSLNSLKTRTEPVKARPKGRTPEGLYGMLGNVAEYLVDGDPTGDDYFYLGARWMGDGFDECGACRGGQDVPSPREDYWGYSHSSNSRADSVGFRLLLDVRKDRSLVTRPRLFQQKNDAWRLKAE